MNLLFINLARALLSVFLIVVYGCAVPEQRPDQPPDQPPPVSPPESRGLIHHTPGEVPDAIGLWAERYRHTTIGISRTHESRTYLLAATEQGTAAIESADVRPEGVHVVVTRVGRGRFDLASIPATSQPVQFHWKEDSLPLPQLYNPHNLREAKLEGRIVVLDPRPGQEFKGAIHVAGYARHLFEGNLVIRLKDQAGKIVSQQPTTGVCCADWGSFQTTIAPAPVPGEYVLELGDYSARDGTWQLFASIPVHISPQ